MKKFLFLASLCLAFSGCANTSNGGGWVVGNGMVDSGTAKDGMNTFGSSDEGTAIPDADCFCQKGEPQCDCKVTPPKKKRKQ